MAIEAMGKYLDLFGSLHRHPKKGAGSAPHKPILLLALLDEIERGHIKENFIPITPELVASFSAYWRTLVTSGNWKSRIVYPFRYLIKEGFWQLVKDGQPQVSAVLGDPTSIGQLLQLVDGGRFDPDLWDLLQHQSAIHALRNVLLKSYFATETVEVRAKLPANPIDYEMERLLSQTQSRFHPYTVRERTGDGYFVRHHLFPAVVKALYAESCAVCQLDVHIDRERGLIDAAHIMPFAEFHYDDPRNGIALCKNHHWGFDSGWFGISDDYRIIVSPLLENALPYIVPDVKLWLPSDKRYWPALDAVNWHRQRKFRTASRV
jgi:putative restriction endonuclease